MNKKTMSDVLLENKLNTREKSMKQKRYLKRQQTKELILFYIVLGFIMIATCMLLMNLQKDSMERCQQAGNSYNTCLANV